MKIVLCLMLKYLVRLVKVNNVLFMRPIDLF